MNRKILIITVIAALVILMAGFGCTIAYTVWSRITTNSEKHYIYIDKDDTADSVWCKIDTVGWEMKRTALKHLAEYKEYKVKTGRYVLMPEDNLVDLLRRLMRGEQEPINLRVPDARLVETLAGKLGARLMIDSCDIARALKDSAICASYGYDSLTITAMIIPETYSVYWNISAKELVARLNKEHKRFWNKERMAKAEELKLTTTEVATLASIIDEETANNPEKPMVAGMYINRLRIGMPLQADPTIKFAMKQFKLRRIYNSMLKTESPYNTYINKGLPPGPIKIASVAGIEAVLNKADHKYLYMCAKEDFSGTHNFARTYREHLANARRYQKALNERKIR